MIDTELVAPSAMGPRLEEPCQLPGMRAAAGAKGRLFPLDQRVRQSSAGRRAATIDSMSHVAGGLDRPTVAPRLGESQAKVHRGSARPDTNAQRAKRRAAKTPHSRHGGHNGCASAALVLAKLPRRAAATGFGNFRHFLPRRLAPWAMSHLVCKGLRARTLGLAPPDSVNLLIGRAIAVAIAGAGRHTDELD